VLIVHPHFHRRRTGVTSHVEAVVGALARTEEAVAIGAALGADVPRSTWSEVAARIRAGEPAVWHAHRNLDLLAGLALRRGRGRRLTVIATRHSGAPPSRYSLALLRAADAVVTLTDHQARALPVESTVVAHGIDVRRFRPPEGADRAERAAALGLGGGRAVGVVGRVRPDKGQGDFVRAFASLGAATRGWTPVLVGLAKGRHARWAEGLARELPGLVLAGERSDVVPVFQALSIAVQPSRARVESFGLVVPEAMACGCAVVATDLPWMRTIIDHGRTGLLVPPGDVAALAAALAELLADHERAEAMGRAAADDARRRFTVEREAELLLALYRAQSGVAHPGPQG
jgi:mannosyltransferase